MKTTFLIEQFDSFEALIHHINQRPAWRRDRLAGQYACEMAGADYHNDDELADEYFRHANGDFMFTAHLNELARHGCRFTKPVALEWAKGCTNLPFDLGD